MFNDKYLRATKNEIATLEELFPEIIETAINMKPEGLTLKAYSNGFIPYKRESENLWVEELAGVKSQPSFNYYIVKSGSKVDGFMSVWLGYDGAGIFQPPIDGFQGNIYSIMEQRLTAIRKNI